MPPASACRARCTAWRSRSAALDAVSPLATLTRGFAIVTRADGSVLTDAAAVAIGERSRRASRAARSARA